MHQSRAKRTLTMLALALALGAGPALAKPPWAGGPSDGAPDKARHEGPDVDIEIQLGGRFADRERTIVRRYYDDAYRGGHCPPGLAKKHNGCMPPGQAKKWRLGHRLPDDIVYYDLSPRLRIELGTPPPGYKFVRVASDILMIAVGTGLVVDAIEDLGRL